MKYRNYLVITTPNHNLQDGWIFIIFSLDGEQLEISKDTFSSKALAEEAGCAWIDLQSGNVA